jgi:hypothetical protein
MRPSVLLAVVALALLALLGWLWARTGSAAGGDLPSPVHGSEIGSAALQKGGSRTAVGEVPGVSTTSAQRDAVASSPSPAPTCRIRVVEAASRTPVPVARLWIQREDVEWESAVWWNTMRRFNDVEPVLQSGLGDELALDVRGEALVPRPSHALCVAASRGELHGDATLEPDKPECTIELKPYHALAIAVVDRSDRPVAGALVALYWGEPDPLENSSIWCADDAGRVSIPKLEDQLWPDPYRGPVRISLACGVQGEPESVAFELESTPADPLRFVAGDFGRVVLHLVDSKGEELTLEGRAHLELEEERIEEPSIALRAGTDVDSTLSSGRAVFATVGLGLTLDVMIAAEGHQPVWRELPGPTEPGQELEVLVTLGDRLVRARGRVHGIGACFGSPRVQLQGRSPGGTGAVFYASLDEDGSFDRPVQYRSNLQGLDGPWTLELSSSGQATVRVTAVPAPDEQAGALEFGDVSIEPQVVLARIHVRDDSGAAVPGAGVEVGFAEGEDQEWCDETGLCVVSGPLAELPMRVRATHHDWLPSDWAVIDAQGSEATLVVRRGATLAGRLLLPRGARSDEFEVRLRVHPETAGTEVYDVVVEPKEEGRFRLAPCEPGLGDLTVYYYDQPCVFERTGIAIPAGQEIELEPIDLRAVLHPFALTFELASGEPWIGGHLEVREPGGELSTWTTIGPSARATFLAVRPSVDIWVGARGARATLFEGVLDDDRLALLPAPSVRLRLPSGIRPPASPLALQVRGSLQSTEELEFETDDDVDVEEALVGEDGTTWLRVPRPGRYELRWFVRHTGTGVELAVEQVRAQVVEVLDASWVPVLEAELARDEVERAIREAGG